MFSKLSPKQIWREIKIWLTPGMGVKRWFGVVLIGTTFIGVGVAIFLLNIYRTIPEGNANDALKYISLSFLPRIVRVLIFGGFGLGFFFWGLIGLNRSLLTPFMQPGKRVVDQISTYRRKERGPRIVVIGGGHGQATLLRGLKEYTHNLTAIVTVADDGGSSGELRRTLGILPPGDIRNCLAALSDDEALLTQLFQYRFNTDSDSRLGGHSFGNLFISALTEVTGSFEEAVVESGRVLSVHGRVLPSTLDNIRLVADVQLPNTASEVRVEGESIIPLMPGRVRRVYLEPNNPAAFPPVIQAILSADMIVIGPGSLYTSLMPNLLVPDVLAAVRASRAFKAYVCNIATQRGETSSYSCLDHVRALEEYIGNDVLDMVLCNDSYTSALPNDVDWVRLDADADFSKTYVADLVDHNHPWRHDSIKLAQALVDLLFDRTGPLGE